MNNNTDEDKFDYAHFTIEKRKSEDVFLMLISHAIITAHLLRRYDIFEDAISADGSIESVSNWIYVPVRFLAATLISAWVVGIFYFVRLGLAEMAYKIGQKPYVKKFNQSGWRPPIWELLLLVTGWSAFVVILSRFSFSRFINWLGLLLYEI